MSSVPVMGISAGQFGVAEPDVPDVVREALRLPGLDMVGFHIHAASNNLNAGTQAAYLGWCVDWSAQTARACGIDLRHVDIGGGIGVAFQGEKPFDVARFGELAARTEPPAGVKIVLEPGRFLVADCGWYAAEVIDVKASYGEWFVVLRGGINHFQLPTCWDIVHNIAVLPVAPWPENCPRPTAEDRRVAVVGELCPPLTTYCCAMSGSTAYAPETSSSSPMRAPTAGSSPYTASSATQSLSDISSEAGAAR
ncbi:hypothetical protein AB0D12_40515 [Streptomyces sp. NPDC048479]|uniref:hypothetical protein n=1 Tax=Streptomyces sp. NPDC048479 TaxID=3154725 RepID=UPI003433000C